jgi:hypothetical protein
VNDVAGTKYWRFTNYTLDHGYPRDIDPPFPEKARAALNLIDRKGHSNVYVFGVRQSPVFKY